MSAIEILGWGDPTGGTAWDAHPDSELKKRMISGVSASQKEIRRVWKLVCQRELVVIGRVREEAVLGITQILRAMGAEIRVDLESGNDERLFAKWPKRGGTKKAIKP
jgi:hypothetical protein